MPIRALAAAILLAATATATATATAGVLADDVPAGAASADPLPAAAAAPGDAPPPIEVVREGAGVADIWRREAGDFPTYGPEGAAIVPTADAQARQALASAYDVQFVGLSAVADGHAPATTAPCTTKSGCIGGHAVERRVRVGDIAQFRLAQALGDAWLRNPADAAARCIPEYRHALTYSADGHAWEMLLCYTCGQYLLRRDGVEVGRGVADEPTGRAEFDGLLASAGSAAATSETGTETGE